LLLDRIQAGAAELRAAVLACTWAAVIVAVAGWFSLGVLETTAQDYIAACNLEARICRQACETQFPKLGNPQLQCKDACNITKWKACVDAAKQEIRQARCEAVPTQPGYYSGLVAAEWAQSPLARKKRALEDEIRDLDQLRAELKEDYEWHIGDVGSVRENLTKVAAVVKATTSTIEALASTYNPAVGVGLQIKDLGVKLVERAYNAIDVGRDPARVATELAKEIATTATSIVGGRIHPVVDGVVTTIQWGKDINTLVKLPSDLNESRNEYLLALDRIDRQIKRIQQQLLAIDSALRAEASSELHGVFSRVRTQMCGQ
jgi:hypothetical protein